MSRLKRKIIKATVRQDAMLGGRCIGYIRGQRSEGRGQWASRKRPTLNVERSIKW
jgi:hypothetical protein